MEVITYNRTEQILKDGLVVGPKERHNDSQYSISTVIVMIWAYHNETTRKPIL